MEDFFRSEFSWESDDTLPQNNFKLSQDLREASL